MRIENNQWKNDFKIVLTIPNWYPKMLTKVQGEDGGYTRFGAILFLIYYYLGWAKIYRNGESIDFCTYVETVHEENKR